MNIPRHIVGVADMKIAENAGEMVVTHALGSCIGVAVFDPASGMVGLLHYMLPLSSTDPAKAAANPFMFGDSGMTALFAEVFKRGASKKGLRVSIAGGAQVLGGHMDLFAIGQRNVLIARKFLWKNGLLIAAEQTGGTVPRTMYLEAGTGQCWLMVNMQSIEL